jgi:hypothetical protein
MSKIAGGVIWSLDEVMQSPRAPSRVGKRWGLTRSLSIIESLHSDQCWTLHVSQRMEPWR